MNDPATGSPVLAQPKVVGSVPAVEMPPDRAAPGESSRRLLRASTRPHNDPGDYARRAAALRSLLAEEGT
jgi:hypothetical protein